MRNVAALSLLALVASAAPVHAAIGCRWSLPIQGYPQPHRLRIGGYIVRPTPQTVQSSSFEVLNKTWIVIPGPARRVRLESSDTNAAMVSAPEPYGKDWVFDVTALRPGACTTLTVFDGDAKIAEANILTTNAEHFFDQIQQTVWSQHLEPAIGDASPAVLYAVDGENAIDVLSASGKLQRRLIFQMAEHPPGSIAVSPDGSLYVASGSQVFVFAAGSGEPGRILTMGGEDAGAVLFDARGDAFVTTSSSVPAWTLDGGEGPMRYESSLRTFRPNDVQASTVASVGRFYAEQAAANVSGTVVLAPGPEEVRNPPVLVYPFGAFETSRRIAGDADVESLAIDDAGRVYALRNRNIEVSVLGDTRALQTIVPDPHTYQLFIGPHGDLYARSGPGIVIYHAGATRPYRTIAAPGDAYFSHVAVRTNGDIYALGHTGGLSAFIELFAHGGATGRIIARSTSLSAIAVAP